MTLEPLEITLPWNDEIRDHYLSDEFAGDKQRRRDQWLEGLQVAVSLDGIYVLTDEQARLAARYAADYDCAESDSTIDNLKGDHYDLAGLLALFTNCTEEHAERWITAADRATCAGHQVENY